MGVKYTVSVFNDIQTLQSVKKLDPIQICGLMQKQFIYKVVRIF